MKFIFYLSIVVICLLVFLDLTNATECRLATEKDRVDARLDKKQHLYRAVIKEETRHVNNIYKKGQRVTQHSTAEGDFAPGGVGALYVFDNLKEAQEWGEKYSYGAPHYKDYYIITFEYTPQKGRFHLKHFDRGTAEWERFINNNWQSKKNPGSYDVVEGPISAPTDVNGRKMKKAIFNAAGKLVWQGAFISSKALSTLMVVDITKHPVPQVKTGTSLNCVIL